PGFRGAECAAATCRRQAGQLARSGLRPRQRRDAGSVARDRILDAAVPGSAHLAARGAVPGRQGRRRQQLLAVVAHHHAAPAADLRLRGGDGDHLELPGVRLDHHPHRRGAQLRDRLGRLVRLQADLHLLQHRHRGGDERPDAVRDPGADAGPTAGAAAAVGAMTTVLAPTRARAQLASQRLAAQRAYARQRALGLALAYAALILAGGVAILPLMYVLSPSLKRGASLIPSPPRWIPYPPYWDNYLQMLTNSLFPRWFLNTLVMACSVTLIKLLLDSMAGYAFAKMQFPMKE